jgi:adenylate cyclase
LAYHGAIAATPPMNKLLRSPPLVAAALGLAVASLVLAARAMGWLQPLEFAAYDRLLELSPETAYEDSRVVTVGLAEQDIMDQRNWWPLPDAVLTQVLERILEAEPRGVGVDLFRDVPVPPGSEALEALLLRDPRVVMVHLSEDEGTPAIPPPDVLVGDHQVGLADVKLDPDDTIRRALLYLDDERGLHLSLALQMAMRWLAPEGLTLGTDPDDPEQIRLGGTGIPRLSGNDGGYAGADSAGYQILIDFEGTRPGRTVSMSEVVRGDVDPSVFRNKLVFVGYTAESVSDLRRVPFGLWPGVYVHAHITSQLVRYGLGEDRPVTTPSELTESLTIVLFALLGAAFALRRPTVTILALTLAAVVVGVLAGGYVALLAGWWLPVAPAALTWLTATGAVETQLARAEHKERQSLMKLFSSHVSRQVAEELWAKRDELMEGGRVPPRSVLATVVFIDVKSFTPIAEALGPLETTAWVNDLMDMLAETTEQHGGFVDDYFGDGMKAAFGVPVLRTTEAEYDADARAAAHCALAIERNLATLNERWRAEGRPEGRLRIGIHSGPVVAASIGHRERLKYTVLGDTVNTAARIESLDDLEHDFEARGVRLLVSEATLQRLDGTYRTRPMGIFALKGKQERGRSAFPFTKSWARSSLSTLLSVRSPKFA